MKRLEGLGVFGGIAIGPLHFYSGQIEAVPRREVDEPKAEIKRAEEARDEVLRQLDELYEQAKQKVGEEQAEVFQIHRMMLEDLDYWESVTGLIESEKANAEWAVEQTAKRFTDMFAAMEDSYMQARADDVTDITRRMLAVLQNRPLSEINAGFAAILAAEDLMPSETLQLDKSKTLAIVTAKGSLNSHASILARTIGIPAVVGLGSELNADCDGAKAIVDGDVGRLILRPDESTLSGMQARKRQHEKQKKQLQALRGQPNQTVDGHTIDVYANIGGPDDLDAVLDNDAGGIGLFRSEFLYIGAKDYPSEEQQFEAYKAVAQRMDGRRVVVRTLDIGADKRADYLGLPHEENPALGMRAVRISLRRPEVFRTQLRALYRASAFGKIAIMFPMIASVWELRQCRKAAKEAQKELAKEGVAHSAEVELGIMIETPAAAITSDLLAKEADFFSIGTNDLTQYTLAADRQNADLAEFADPHHPALLRLMQTVVANAHKAGIWVGVCGELGADPAMTYAFLKAGVDELSVAAASVLPLRQRIRQIDLRQPPPKGAIVP